MPITPKQQVRIIGGQWKSRKIHFPFETAIRPTPDRVRETLFNWLSPYLLGASCLDLFAGSGVLSFEALSRGAAQVTLCDKSTRVIKQLLQTAKELNAPNEQTLICPFVFSPQSPVPAAFSAKRYDIVFIDPPFYQNLITPICQWLVQHQLIDTHSLIYIETENIKSNDSATSSLVPDTLQILKEGKTTQTRYFLTQLDKNQRA